MYIKRTTVVIAAFLFASSLPTAASAEVSEETRQRIESCRSNTFEKALTGKIKLSSVVDLKFFTQQMVGAQIRTLTASQVARIQEKAAKAIDIEFEAEGHDLFKNAEITIGDIDERVRNGGRTTIYTVQGTIKTAKDEYSYDIVGYLLNYDECRITYLKIEGAYKLHEAVAESAELSALFKEFEINR